MMRKIFKHSIDLQEVWKLSRSEEVNSFYFFPNMRLLIFLTFHRVFFNSMNDKHQPMHFTFNNILA